MFISGRKWHTEKEDVEQLLPKDIKKETQVVEDTLAIIELLEDDSKLEIIVNTFLFPDLHSIAIITTNSLKDANKYIIQNIRNKFLQAYINLFKLLVQRAIKLMTVKKSWYSCSPDIERLKYSLKCWDI